ncbi:hypothetical protein ACJMK2_033978 [Sinanodonta woodiana]|uniref:TMC domain-containing protein n=1 Tax=Sinanodonta woodiana TaxID=1069815 RepID=A0ABD3WUC3_SINWO
MKGTNLSYADYIPLPVRDPAIMEDRQDDVHDTFLTDDQPQGQSRGDIRARHNGGSHYQKYPQGHHMYPLPTQIYDRYVDSSTMERPPKRERSFRHHEPEPPSDYEMGTNVNMNDSQDFKIPSFRQDNPVATIIRRRNASSRNRSTIRRREREDINDYVEVEDNHMLPSIQIQRRERHKTLKERRSSKKAGIVVSENDDADKAKSFRERYAETKEKHDITPRHLASILRETASAKITDWTRPKKWDKITKGIREFFQNFSIWSSHMRVIEGRFGTAIMSYFRFLRWLMFLNAYIMIIQFFSITVPYLALSPRTFTDTVPPNASKFIQDAQLCTQNYSIYHENNMRNESDFQKFLDFLLGTGWMERTVLFYGEYFNKTYYMPDGMKTYDMGLAYLLSAGVSFIISFILIVKNSSKAIKGTFGMEKSVAMFVNKVFCGWDYCIRNKKAAKVKKKSLLTDFRESLEEQRKTWEKAEESRIKLFGIRVGMNLLIFGILAGALFLVYYTTDRLVELQKEKLSEIVALIVQYIPTITITILNFIIPILFQKIVVLEKYSSRAEINITLARSIILRLASLVVLVGTLYRLLILGSADFKTCGNNKWADSTNSTSATKGSIKCWETYVGQQIYKLVLLDLIVEVIIVVIVQFPRRLIYNKYQKKHKLVQKLGPNEFDLTQNVIDIIYTQTISWFGMFFSPLIPFITFLKCVIFFYVRKWTVLSNCAPAEKTNATSRSNSLFMMVLLLSFVFVTVPIGYMVGYVPPSQSCGPFRVYSDNTTNVMFDTISLTIKSWPNTARDIFFFFGTVGFLVPVMILLVLLMYYFWLLGQGYKKREQLLTIQLKLEGQDKKFLLSQVNAILMQADAGNPG